jgi:adenylate cyclase
MRQHEGPATRHFTEMATVAFVDLAGFSAITDVYGDEAAIWIIELFEELVSEALGSHAAPLKWIGDEAMLAFSSPELALEMLGRLLASCRSEPRLPLTRCGVSHGRVIRRSNDLFGSTVNIAARVTALAGPGQLLATQPIVDFARTKQIVTREIGNIALRSVANEIPIFSLELAPAPDPSWIDPVCKMHPPYRGFKLEPRDKPWFCSPRCAEAYKRSPETYPTASSLRLR